MIYSKKKHRTGFIYQPLLKSNNFIFLICIFIFHAYFRKLQERHPEVQFYGTRTENLLQIPVGFGVNEIIWLSTCTCPCVLRNSNRGLLDLYKAKIASLTALWQRRVPNTILGKMRATVKLVFLRWIRGCLGEPYELQGMMNTKQTLIVNTAIV